MKVLVGGRAEEILGTIIFGVSGDKPVVTELRDSDGCEVTSFVETPVGGQPWQSVLL